MPIFIDYLLFTIDYFFRVNLRLSAVIDYFLVLIRNTIRQNVVFYARFLFWPIVTFLYVVSYEAFLLDELFGCGQGRSPRLRRVNQCLI